MVWEYGNVDGNWSRMREYEGIDRNWGRVLEYRGIDGNLVRGWEYEHTHLVLLTMLNVVNIKLGYIYIWDLALENL